MPDQVKVYGPYEAVLAKSDSPHDCFDFEAIVYPIGKCDEGGPVAIVSGNDREDALKKAKLIAAAPELLEALQKEVEFLAGLLFDMSPMLEVHKSKIRTRIVVLNKEIKKATQK